MGKSKTFMRRAESKNVERVGDFIVKSTQFVYFLPLALMRLEDNSAFLTRGYQAGLLAGYFNLGLLLLAGNQIANEARAKQERGTPRDWLGHFCHFAFVAANCMYTAGIYTHKDSKMLVNMAHIVYAVGYVSWAALELNAFRGEPMAQTVESPSQAGMSNVSVMGSPSQSATNCDSHADDDQSEFEVPLTRQGTGLANIVWTQTPKPQRAMNLLTAAGCVAATFALLMLSMEGPKIPGVPPHFSPNIPTGFAITAAAAFLLPTLNTARDLARSVCGFGV